MAHQTDPTAAEPMLAMQATVARGVLTVTTTNDLVADNCWIERRALLRRFEAQELVLQWRDPSWPSHSEPVEFRYRPGSPVACAPVGA